MKIAEILINIKLVPSYIWDLMWAPIYKRAMKYCGKRVRIRPSKVNIKGIHNLSLADDVNIPRGATFFCTDAPISIGRNVGFGPNPTIITGNHRIDVAGKFYHDVKEKRLCDDLPVVIQDDVWCGANITILKGVTIGSGAVIAAGSIVTKNVPPCEIWGGVPAKFIKKRFKTEIEEQRHLEFLSEKD